MVIRKTELPGRLVAKLYQLLELRGNDFAYFFRRLPDFLAAFRLGRRFENLAKLGVGHFLAADLGPIGAELLLDGIAQGRQLLEKGGIDLLFEIGQVDNVDGPFGDGIVDPALFLNGLDLGKPFLVGQKGVDLVLGFFLAFVIFLLARHVGSPPGVIRLEVERPNLLDERIDQLTGPVRVLRIGGSVGRPGHPYESRQW